MAKKPVQLDAKGYRKFGMRDKLAYAAGDFGCNMSFALKGTVQTFWLVYMMMETGLLSALLLVVQIWDAINDPMIGSLADRTRTKMGRYRPWMMVGAIGLIPLVILSFWAHPEWSVGARTAYSCILYIVVVIFSTSWNIPYSALNGVISPYPEERASFSGHRIFISSLACALATAIFMPLAMKFGLNEGNAVKGYLVAAIIVCAIAIPFVFTAILGTKEAVAAPPAEKKEKFSAKLVWNAFSKNPPLLIVCFAFLVYGFLNYGRMTVGMYYFTYVWGNVNLFTVYATFNGIFAAVGGFCGPLLVKMFKGKRNALLASYALQAVLNLATFFMLPGNASSAVVLALMFISGLGNGIVTGLLYGMIGDTVDYGQWKTGVRADGLCSSGTSLMLKLGGAIAPTMLLAMLAANGYVANAAEQTAGALSTMNLVMNMIPALLCALSFVVFLFYKLNTEKHYQIIEELKARGEYDVQ